VTHLNTRLGVAVGYCPSTQTDTYITYSPTLGIQTWFTHKGECGSCAQRVTCEKMLRQLAAEWMITLPDNQSPTEVALLLFNTISEQLTLKEKKQHESSQQK
jgi:hypothetical protein